MKLFVGNIPYTVTEESLKELFKELTTIESIKLITDRDTGRSKGFGFVELTSDEEAESAIKELNGKEIDGRKIIVSEAKPQKPRERNGRGGNGDGNRFGDRERRRRF
jgi:cold-inducible RNA-binding protein